MSIKHVVFGLLVLASMPTFAFAQGTVQGAEQGARRGEVEAGPVGAVVGGAVGAATGTVNGVLGVGAARTMCSCQCLATQLAQAVSMFSSRRRVRRTNRRA